MDPSIEVFELQPPDSVLDPKQAQSLLYSSDLELGETVKMVFAAADRAKPSRIVIDSLSEIRLLAQNSLRYRRQLLAMKHYFARSAATVLALDDLTADANDKTAHSIAHGVVRLEELAPDYGAERRRLRVVKYRGQVFRGGFHDFAIKTGGLQVYPASGFERASQRLRACASSAAAMPRWTRCWAVDSKAVPARLILGPAGAGKSLLVFQFIAAACAEAKRRRCLPSTRNSDCCSGDRRPWGSTWRR